MAARYQQITAHVATSERAGFEAYAGKFGLDAGNLLHLLWQRELRVGRLGSIDPAFREQPMGCDGKGLESKVTTHLTDLTLKPRITKRAADVGLSVSRAGATLLRDEMGTRWLQSTLDLVDSN